MRRHDKPINETATRIAELRTNLHELYKARQTRELTATEERKIDRIAREIHQLQGGD